MATKKKVKKAVSYSPVVVVGVADQVIDSVLEGLFRRVMSSLQDPNFLHMVKLLNQLQRL